MSLKYFGDLYNYFHGKEWKVKNDRTKLIA